MSQSRDGTVTVADAYEIYPNEWVLMEITRKHNDYRKERGRVLAHSLHRDDLLEARRQFRVQHPHDLLSEFFAGDPIPEGVVVVL